MGTHTDTSARACQNMYAGSLFLRLKCLQLGHARIPPSLLLLTRWLHSYEKLVPFVMRPRWRGTPTGERLFQELNVRYRVFFHQAPFRKFMAAGSSDLVCEKLRSAVLNSVIMWFEDPLLVVVHQPDHARSIDC